MARAACEEGETSQGWRRESIVRMAGVEAMNSENSWVIGRVSSRRREEPGDWRVTLKSTPTHEKD